MQYASRLFTADDRARVSKAVAAAESRTAAEIVPAVASASGRYDRPEDVIGLWTGLIAMSAAWLLLPVESPEVGSWSGMPAGVQLAALIAAMIGGFVVGAVIGSRIGWLRRLFTARQQMREEVLARARAVWFDRRVHHTATESGLLIYVSLFERMAAIIADQNALEKLGQAGIDELCAELTAQLRTENPTEALCRTIAAAGDRLASVLPRAHDDLDELHDALVVLD
jgi:putative membrane protein